MAESNQQKTQPPMTPTTSTGVKNYACVEVRPSAGTLLVYLNLDPAAVEFEEGFSRDVSSIGHWGTGNVEAVLREPADVQRVLPLLDP